MAEDKIGFVGLRGQVFTLHNFLLPAIKLFVASCVM